MVIQFSQHHLLKRGFFSPMNSPVLKINWQQINGLISGLSNFIPLVYMFILILLPHCFGDYSFVVSLKWQTLSPSFVLFQNCFETVPKFRAPVTICELENLFFRPWKQKAVWIWYRLHWICRSLWVALLSSNSNTHEHRMFFCLGLT